MSRSQEKLQSVADEIRKERRFYHTCSSNPFFFTGDKYQREVRIISVDFSLGQEIYPKIAEELKDLDIGVLGEFVGSLAFEMTWPRLLYTWSSLDESYLSTCSAAVLGKQCLEQAGRFTARTVYDSLVPRHQCILKCM